MSSNYDLGIQYPSSAASAPGASSSSDKTRKTGNELGQNEFLKLLVAQMSNQDPMNPTSDTEFIAQMAQFSALEQMHNVSNAVQSQRAYSMIGKDITSNTVVDNEGNKLTMEVYGNVTGVSKLKDEEYLVVYDYANEIEVLVPPTSVRTVFDNPDATTTMQLESIYNQMTALLEKIDALTSALGGGSVQDEGEGTEAVEDTDGTDGTEDV